MTTVKSIELILENCEAITFKYPDVCILEVGEVRTGFVSCCNVIGKETTLDGFSIVINGKAKPELHLFTEGVSWLTRLTNYKDVTQLKVNYNNNISEVFMVYWLVEEEYSHKGQRLIHTPEGNFIFYSEAKSYKNTICVDTADSMCYVSQD